MTERIGELLIEADKIRRADLERALRAQQEAGGLLGEILVKLGLLPERDLMEVLARQLQLELVTEKDFPRMPVLEDLLKPAFLKESGVLPLDEDGETVTVAMARPQDAFVVRAIEMATHRRVQPVLALPAEIEAGQARLYAAPEADAEQEEAELGADLEDIEHLKDLASEAPVIRRVNQIMNRALESRASDIHIEPFEGELKVRYRVDGVLREVDSPPAQLAPAIISRIKIMARLNIAERRLPQDGRIQLRLQGKTIDLRVSTVPTMHGESVVMRILDRERVELDLQKMGFSRDNLDRFLDALSLPHGVILVTGPTGSGKTTTLYACLTRLNTPERKILTVEDPVEYQLVGINQIQVKSRIGMDFASSLRAIVRQDPDVIMIGEMRDLETARIGVQSALTGHLVLSTVHTNDAGGGVTRLLDMGVDDYLLTSTINGILAQRLVRRLCPDCREAYTPSAEIVADRGLEAFADGPIRLFEPVGCEACGHTGYRGRTAVHEFLEMSDGIRRLILDHADASTVQAAARREGMLTMYEDGLRKAMAGETTIEEVLRVTQETESVDV